MKPINKKKVIKIILYIVLVISILSLIEWPREIDQSKIQNCIDKYYVGKGDKIINSAYKVLGSNKHGMIVNEYIYLEKNDYIIKDNKLDEQSSRVDPVRVKLISLFGFYKIIMVSNPPEDGGSYAIYTKLYFPKDILKNLDDNRQSYGAEMSQKLKEQLEEIKSNLK